MIVICNHEKLMRDAYVAGAAAAILHLKAKGPKPDADKYVAGKEKKPRAIPKF